MASLIKIKTASLLNPVNTCAKIESVNWNLEEVIKLYPLTDGDYVLIREAQKAICLNYDKENNNDNNDCRRNAADGHNFFQLRV